ncbi:hypothetical protein SAY86_019419 [Trapa natans]|uniref:Uncharacterized protein n=1 Tax=Trapa natans TaxID=22666 RepID=A0AAN7LLT3_TRANT|nr:hypothetical protein SAY86_019419 [Trapa natans]
MKTCSQSAVERGGGSHRDEIRKGPWKAEEDEVLLNHVRRYGPRDWSSIRSKGLLQRTGKSCRLRWVNKLRPNLKNGCKFTQEEERIVIELQAQFGNKWARIASYLPGRTDNDVKNFWSSRQKRLARILQTSSSAASSAPASSSKSHLRSTKRDSSAPVMNISRNVPSAEILKVSSLREEWIPPNPQCSLPELQNIPQHLPENHNHLVFPSGCQELFPPIPQAPPPPQSGISFIPGGYDFLGRLEDSNFFNAFEPIETVTGIGEAPGNQFSEELPFFEVSAGFRSGSLDTFFDDFPADMFDDNVDSPAISASPRRSS